MHAFVCAELSYCACGGTMDVSLLASVCVSKIVCARRVHATQPSL